MTAQEKRNAVAKQYALIIGRNHYSQNLRDYCYKPYKDGNYYSDCSSSISYAYRQAGLGFGILNTAGIYYSDNMTTVTVGIENGVPSDFSKLRVGDMLEFAGTDGSRPLRIGHVEMVYSINANGTITICGHGSGTPSYKDLTAYCRQRYQSLAPGGWRKGLVCVRRYIQDDGSENGPACSSVPISTSKTGLCVTASSLNIRKTPGGSLTGRTYKKNQRIQVKAKARIDGAPWFQVSDGNWISARYLTGWVREASGRWWYVTEGYHWYQNEIRTIDGSDYLFGDDGYMVTGWFRHDGQWMYAGSDGAVVKNDWIRHTDGKDYWVNDKGIWEEAAQTRGEGHGWTP